MNLEDVKIGQRLIYKQRDEIELIIVNSILESVIECNWRAGKLYLYPTDFENNRVLLAFESLQKEPPKRLIIYSPWL